jgi:hypothetical protein
LSDAQLWVQPRCNVQLALSYLDSTRHITMSAPVQIQPLRVRRR